MWITLVYKYFRKGHTSLPKSVRPRRLSVLFWVIRVNDKHFLWLPMNTFNRRGAEKTRPLTIHWFETGYSTLPSQHAPKIFREILSPLVWKGGKRERRMNFTRQDYLSVLSLIDKLWYFIGPLTFGVRVQPSPMSSLGPRDYWETTVVWSVVWSVSDGWRPEKNTNPVIILSKNQIVVLD